MKVWIEYGSEHTVKLMVIGTFDSAEKAKETVHRITTEELETQSFLKALLHGNAKVEVFHTPTSD